MEQLRQEFDDFARFLRQVLQLTALPPEARRARKGRRFRAALTLARPAARAQRTFQPYLQDLPQGAEDLAAQEARVRLLVDLHRRLLELTRAVGDTLLRERAELLHMGLAVSDALHLLLAYAELPPALRRRMGASLRALRRRAEVPPAPARRALKAPAPAPQPSAPSQRRRR